MIDVVDRDDGVVLAHRRRQGAAPGPTHGPHRLGAPLRAHAAAHRPARAVGRRSSEHARRGPSSFHLGIIIGDHRPCAGSVASSDRGSGARRQSCGLGRSAGVACGSSTSAEAAHLPLRKEPRRSGRLRIVEVDGFDLSACGGTHVSRTGAIGNISIGSFERFRGGMRVEFRCGIRALQGIVRCGIPWLPRRGCCPPAPEDLPAATERLQAENNEGRRRIKHLQEQLAGHEASVLAEPSRKPGRRVHGHRSAGRLGCERPEGCCQRDRRAGRVMPPILVSRARPVSIVVARAPDRSIDAAAIVKALTAKFGGKGGGRSQLAQSWRPDGRRARTSWRLRRRDECRRHLDRSSEDQETRNYRLRRKTKSPDLLAS